MYSGHKKSSQEGQVLLLVVLASVIALTVGLAAVSRSITSTRISTEESNSQKALSAAEAGVEEQIAKTLAGNFDPIENKPLGNNSFIDSTAVPDDDNTFEMRDGSTISQDEGADIWLSEYPTFERPTSPQNLKIYWIATGDCSRDPALEIVVVYGLTKTDPSMRRYAVDSCTRSPSNNFTLADSDSLTFDGGITVYNKSFTLPAIPSGYIARVIPLYNSAKIAVESDVNLPPQGYTIESTGSSGDTVRKVQVYQEFPKLPIEFFPYNLFLP